MHVEHVRDQVGNDGRARAPLRQRILMAGNLGDHGRHIFIQLKILVAHEEAADAAEVDGRKEVLKVDIENEPAVAMLLGVGDDRSPPFEPMGNPILSALGSLDFIEAILEQERKAFVERVLRRRRVP